MILIKVQYDAYNRQFKLLDPETARKLEDAGYVTCEKSFKGRTPLTEYVITKDGRTALGRYLDHMEALIKAMKNRS